MRKRRTLLLALAGILILACSCPAIAAATPTPSATTAATSAVEGAPPTAPPIGESPVASQTTAPTACSPQLTANSNVNVRNGPAVDYNEVGALSSGQTAAIDGQNTEGTWWYIVYAAAPGGHGWVAASVTTATCVSGSIAVIIPPATSTPKIPIGVTGVSVHVDPKTINIGGCVGPLQQSLVAATITVNGPISLQWHFETDQNGSLGNHSLDFAKAGSKEVSANFTPVVEEGTFQVRIVIDGQDLGGMDYQAKYKINC